MMYLPVVLSTKFKVRVLFKVCLGMFNLIRTWGMVSLIMVRDIITARTKGVSKTWHTVAKMVKMIKGWCKASL